MSSSGNALQPSYQGFVLETIDALILFEGIVSGSVPIVTRRPHDRERNQLITHGSVFIFDENASGIKRWTDGVAWSPSRIQGNFLLYRELDKPFGPGEKKKAQKKVKKEVSPVLASAGDNQLPDRNLVGSLVDSYQFKEGGLMKKTMSLALYGSLYHLVSYYLPETANDLTRPFNNPNLKNIRVRADIRQSGFKMPLTDLELTRCSGEFRPTDMQLQHNNLPPLGATPGYTPQAHAYLDHLQLQRPGHAQEYGQYNPYTHSPVSTQYTIQSYQPTASPHHAQPNGYSAHLGPESYSPISSIRRDIAQYNPTATATQHSQPRTLSNMDFAPAITNSLHYGTETEQKVDDRANSFSTLPFTSQNLPAISPITSAPAGYQQMYAQQWPAQNYRPNPPGARWAPNPLGGTSDTSRLPPNFEQ